MSFHNLCRKPAKLLNISFAKYLLGKSSRFHNCIASSKSLLSGHEKINFLSCSTSPSFNFHTSVKCLDDKNQSLLPGEDPSQPMKRLTFIKPDGEETAIQGRVGLTVMQEAMRNNLPIEGACEGNLACTTCHVYVEDCIRKDGGSENPYLEGRTIEEDDMLDSVPFGEPCSRLSCQLKISPDCENAIFRIPFATVNFTVGRDEEKK